MKKLFILATCLAALALAPTTVLASKVPKCPACHMALSKKKNKEHPTAVKIKGKTYYCCGSCTMKKK